MPNRRTSGFTLIELLLVLGIVIVLTAIAIPALFSARQSANEASATALLRNLHPVETAWRQGDLDGNGRADFWTLDVSGLYRVLDDAGRPLEAISRDLAAADACPGDALTSGRPRLGDDVAPQGPKALRGYFFRSMLSDRSGRPFQVDGPDNDSLPWENPTGFGFAAFPAEWNATASGKWDFFMMEDGVIWTRNLKGRGPGGAAPAGARAPGFQGGQLAWPGPAGSTDLSELPEGPWQIVR